jgi:predicted ATP-binding protein involved in virulence
MGATIRFCRPRAASGKVPWFSYLIIKINLILDEIELYFHPEYQRKFISELLKAISRQSLEKIEAINILFSTHSPFILSDLPKSNILMLTEDNANKQSVPGYPDKNTFGANIHELLSESFFLSNSIGDFSKSKIDEILDFYSTVRSSTDNFVSLKELFNHKKEYYYLIVENIGEDFIRGILSNHLNFLNEYFNEIEASDE